MSQGRSEHEGEAFSFITGLIVGFAVSAPLAAWMSPRSGGEVRRNIVQRGLLVRRQVGQTIRKPLERVQEQLEQLKGDSVEVALEEGKAIAAQRQTGSAH